MTRKQRRTFINELVGNVKRAALDTAGRHFAELVKLHGLRMGRIAFDLERAGLEPGKALATAAEIGDPVKHVSLALLRKRAMTPYPVVSAELGNGEEFRCTFYQEQGKPWDLERARRTVLGHVIGRFLNGDDRRPGEQRPPLLGIRSWKVWHNGVIVADCSDTPGPGGKRAAKPKRAAASTSPVASSHERKFIEALEAIMQLRHAGEPIGAAIAKAALADAGILQPRAA